MNGHSSKRRSSGAKRFQSIQAPTNAVIQKMNRHDPMNRLIRSENLPKVSGS